MATTSVYALHSGNGNVLRMLLNTSIGLSSRLVVYTNGVTNIYSSPVKNASGSADSSAMYTVKSGTAMTVIGRDIGGSDNSVCLKVKCGSKTGYVYVGTISRSGTRGDTYRWAKGPYVGLAMNKSIELSALKLTESDRQPYTASFSTLNNNNEVDPNRLYSAGSTDGADSNPDATDASAIASTAGAANGADSGEIDVTYEYAVKVNPPFPWNIADHFGKTAEFEDSEDYAAESLNGFDYSSLKYIFGVPYQLLPSADARVGAGFSDSLEAAGYEFSEKIAARVPLLYITPGNTSFMGGSTKNARGALIGSLEQALGISASSGEEADTESPLESMLGEYNGKLYSIMPAYVEYFKYVNPLCRAGAIFLNIGGMNFNSIDVEGNPDSPEVDGINFSNFNWGTNEGIAYEVWEEEENTEEEDKEEEATEKPETKEEEETEEETEPTKAKYERDYSDYFKLFEDSDVSSLKKFEKNLYYKNAIAFYINSDASFQDSFTNETSESSLSSTINALSDKAREIQFLLGTAKNAVGEAFDRVDETLSDVKSQINNIVESISGGNTIFTTIANSVKTIVSGGRMLFPQIWANSTFSKSYNISIKLNSPSTDRVSWWLNIYVPLCHLMALVLPRSEYVNSYTTPFIIKAFYKGMFNIDMGIITEMSFNKGKEGSWTKDGLPTVVDVSFTIQDLYSAMGMTSTESMFKGFTLQNVAELDYVANLCGININEPDVLRMGSLFVAFNFSNRIHDVIPTLSMGLERYVANGIMNAYNNFWF